MSIKTCAKEFISTMAFQQLSGMIRQKSVTGNPFAAAEGREAAVDCCAAPLSLAGGAESSWGHRIPRPTEASCLVMLSLI